jgi:ribulose 1,5-bisphosphate synthetase/thiazole synthase
VSEPNGTRVLIQAEALSAGSKLSAHIAVVGAGPAGMTVALEVAKSGLDVLLIESGHGGLVRVKVTTPCA